VFEQSTKGNRVIHFLWMPFSNGKKKLHIFKARKSILKIMFFMFILPTLSHAKRTKQENMLPFEGITIH